VVSGSIPPQKSDLTRFYEASEFVGGPGGGNFLYLGWERRSDHRRERQYRPAVPGTLPARIGPRRHDHVGA
jgi:hypothetical protein